MPQNARDARLLPQYRLDAHRREPCEAPDDRLAEEGECGHAAKCIYITNVRVSHRCYLVIL